MLATCFTPATMPMVHGANELSNVATTTKMVLDFAPLLTLYHRHAAFPAAKRSLTPKTYG